MLAPILALIGTFAFAEAEGIYATVTESACNEEIHILPDGEGKIVNACRREDGSHRDDVNEQTVTWVVEGDVLVVHSDSTAFSFTVYQSLSCAPFGRAGNSPGIVGRGKSYWKSPITCR